MVKQVEYDSFINAIEDASILLKDVLLTEDEVIDLKDILQSFFDNYIERLSTYIQSTGKTYKDHKATILSWFYKDRGNFKQTNKAKSYSLEDYEMGDYL